VSKVFVHFRANSEEKARNRVIHAAKAAGWWREALLTRVQVCIGDLGKPQLGLSGDMWNRLNGKVSVGDRIHAVIHNGAAVRWDTPYSALKGTNVSSTVELLKALADTECSTNFIYVSGGQRLSLTEEPQEHMIAQVLASTGYAQTKLVSELLVKTFASCSRARGHRIAVIKPSYIIGTPQLGNANMDDYLWRLIAGAVGAQVCCRNKHDEYLLLSDVERVARYSGHGKRIMGPKCVHRASVALQNHEGYR
jgi:thioester reductase-like protein